jgi:hypothetical protein
MIYTSKKEVIQSREIKLYSKEIIINQPLFCYLITILFLKLF